MRKFLKAGAALVAVMAVAPASAQVSGSLGIAGPNPLSLNSTGLSNGATPVASLVGSSIYNNDLQFADRPAGTVFGGNFLAAGPTSGNVATLAFLSPISFLNFLWGSPDAYNVLTVNSTAGTQTFTAAGLGFPVISGSQSFSQYVHFTANAGTLINSVSFSNSPTVDAFEAANFSVTAPVPEPATWALMFAGFGMIGFTMRRRNSKVTAKISFA